MTSPVQAPPGPAPVAPAASAPLQKAPAARRLTALWDRLDDDDTQLFDVPGPRGRRRIALATVVSLLVIAGFVAAALHQFAAGGQLDAAKWQLFGQWPVLKYLLTGLWATVEVTLVSGAIALPLGALLALARLARTPLLRIPATVYVEVLRAVPLLLLVYAFLFGLPGTGVQMSLFWMLVWPIVITNSAVFAEIFRAGVRAVPKGQSEAGAALGFGHWSTMRLIVLPQAIRQTAPALVSQLVRLLKDSTLGYVVSFPELLQSAKVLGEFNHTVIQSFLVVALAFVIVNVALAFSASRLERWLGGGSGRPNGTRRARAA
ncbi:amino acid ABC transporter permease [Streptomyces sp. NPDC002514]|uniref:amino acid ABC transporter permease n=1 Tax=unclassified Streptomyces TaxID=2593676 RepID=UPI00369F8A79